MSPTALPATPSSPKRATFGLSAAWRVVIAGLAISIALATCSAYWEYRRVQEEVRELASERTELIAAAVRVSMQVLYSLQSLHAATAQIEPTAFARFARDARARHPELQALEWAPQVPAAARPAFEAVMRRAGHAGFSITEIDAQGQVRPAAQRERYFPVQWIEPMAGNEASQGLDLALDERCRAALERARASREPAATAPIRLAQQAGDQPGFVVLLPLYRNGSEPEGFALAVFRFDDLIRHAMRDLDGRGIAFSLDDVTEPPAQRVFGNTAEDTLPGAALVSALRANGVLPGEDRHETLAVAGRRWQLNFVPETGFVLRHLPWQTAAMFIGCLLVTALVAAAVQLLSRRRIEVARAKAALQAEVVQRELATQAANAASQSKSTFLANMSHEIRTPMNAVLGYAQLLRRDDQLDATQHEAVSAIITSGSHLMSQINEVLDFSKIESGRIELNRVDFDLNAALRDLERMFQPRGLEKNLPVTVSPVPARQAWVHGDGVKLLQILINLLGNAVRFTSVGEVVLRSLREERSAGSAEGGTWYRFDVIDTGPGIAADERERIFEPFYQSATLTRAATGGTGLGLAIAKRQAEGMGGRLEVASEPGAGSVFTLRVPLAPASAGASRGSERTVWRWTLASQGAPLGVLVIDEVLANRDVLARLLREAGCQVHVATDAAQALHSMGEHTIEVVFMDMRMPGVDGLSALQALRVRPRETPLRIIAYTAAAFEPDRVRFTAAGCDGVVTKPIDVNTLFTTLAAVSGRRFERSDMARDDEDAPLREPDWARLRVAPELLQRMVTAAELNSATVLKAYVDELRQGGPEHELLARHLRRHLRAYDMLAVTRLLLQVEEDDVALRRKAS